MTTKTKLTSEELAYKVYAYNKPVDYSWIRYLINKQGTEATMRGFIEGYVEAEGLDVSKNLMTRAVPELEHLLR